ncbi:MAG: glycine cleavage system aminomethyltransferase GcvT [Chloroflexi bacterium]|nr:glycine cleavage system aminomethyltransferase GcvT [Chloroflexota bacterium]
MNRTSLYQTHVSLGGKMVPFAGWEMPIQFQGILAEARAVRSRAGLFDVSHMGRVDIAGRDAAVFLQKVLTADVLALAMGRARYSLICNESGGIIDDTIVYRLEEKRYRLVPNAANTGEVLAWLGRWKDEMSIQAETRVLTRDTTMIAVQGPSSQEMLQTLCDLDLSSLRAFRVAEGSVAGIQAQIARTGYTGEDGFEVIAPAADAPSLWSGFMDRGATPCGLGARDVLRIEAGLLLHGSDMDSSTTPLEAGLERFVSLDKNDFVGRSALLEQKERGLSRSLVGFRLLERGVPRHGYPVLDGGEVIGEVTSGTHSPTLDMGIGLGYVALRSARPGSMVKIDLRGRPTDAEVVELPFYRRKRQNAP